MSYPPPTLTLPPLGRGDLNRLIDSWNGDTDIPIIVDLPSVPSPLEGEG